MGLNIIGVSAFSFTILHYFVRERDLALALCEAKGKDLMPAA